MLPIPLVGESVTNPLKYYDNNLYGTKVLLDAIEKNGIDKIVFSSTAATYGEPENIPILESDRTCPTNPYGETKLAMEKMFSWTAKAHILAVRYLENGGESDIFNLGNGIGYSVRKVIDTARKVTGHPIPEIEVPRRAGDPAMLVASSEKARCVLGWKPEHDSLEEIIASAWNWLNNHPNGYSDR